MKIGIDVDGVISDFVGTFKEIVKKRYNVSLNEKDIREHDLYKILGIKPEEAFELVQETLSHDLKPQIGAVESINQLYRSHKIIILTARPPETLDITKKWLEKHNIMHHDLIYSKEGSKFEYDGKLDVIIDDHLREIINWIGKIPIVIVYNHPWNKSLNVKKNFLRANNWNDILKIIGI